MGSEFHGHPRSLTKELKENRVGGERKNKLHRAILKKAKLDKNFPELKTMLENKKREKR